mgnify:CR=1 FL=1
MTNYAEEFDVDFEGELPDTLDEASLERIRTVAYLLDESIDVPGTPLEVGIDPALSMIPVVGDAIGAGLSLYIVAEAAYLGVGPITVARMLANVTIDFVGGSLPYVGPVFDAFWKSNKRNLELALNDLAVEPDESDDEEFVEIEVEEA